MVTPESGPFLFDTSAEAWFARPREASVRDWMRQYLNFHQFNVSAIGVIERIRGYSLLWQAASEHERTAIDASRLAYLEKLSQVFATDSATAIAAGDIMALVPNAPTPPRRTHRLVESRQDRLARWRFDCIVAATALVTGLPLIHNHAQDFEAIRGAIELLPERFPSLGPLRLIPCSSLL